MTAPETIPQTKDLLLPVERITPAGEHFFFGYYDNPSWSADEAFHLCQHVPFWDRLPAGDDCALLGMVRLTDRSFLPLGETNAWNFQQGAMLQWHPLEPNEKIIFNRFTGGGYVGVIRHVHLGDEFVLERPVACISPDGCHALSVNFSRVFDFRPGYGYANTPDPWRDVPAPEDDGIYRVNLLSGASELILSYAGMAALFPGQMAGAKLVVNHITFNTDGTRFVALLRNFPDGENSWWATALITADVNGGNVYPLRGYGYESHYHWRDPGHLLIYGDAGGPQGLYLLTDRTQEAELLDPDFFAWDGHCSYSPDRQWLLYDCYPRDGYRHLYLYELAAQRPVELGAFYSSPQIDGDIRCDLHPRWSRTGKSISFDSIHEGFRGIYTFDVSSIVG